MNVKTAILAFVLLLLMAGGVVVGVYLVRQNQDVRSRADANPTQTDNPALPASTSNDVTNNAANNAVGTNPAGKGNTAADNNQGGSCTPPEQVANVKVDYP